MNSCSNTQDCERLHSAYKLPRTIACTPESTDLPAVLPVLLASPLSMHMHYDG